MIDVEMWFVWCKGVVFGMVLSVIIKEFGEWVRSRRPPRALDGAYCSCKNPDVYINRICQLCGLPHAPRQ